MKADCGHEALIINCGSSSLKLAWLDAATGVLRAKGLVERIGEIGTKVRFTLQDVTIEKEIPGLDHGAALRDLVGLCWTGGVHPSSVVAIGHRIVHGGEFFSHPCLIDDEVIARIRACAELAPLHNPAHLEGIKTARDLFPDLPHVAVFDTAFHQTMPAKAFHYAIPYQWYEEFKARKYGFHGTSHQFVSREAAVRLGRPANDCQVVTAHLGNGCSVCAVKNGKSVDTSMGLTPSEGLVMGTRSGDIDPNLTEYIAGKSGLSIREVNDMINRKSGLLGISGLSNDMRTLTDAAIAGQPRAALAIEVFCYRLARQVLAMCAALTRMDALVFTGGIGEHSAVVREKTLSALTILRPELDPERNQANGIHSQGRITCDNSNGLVALVIPTNEEWMIGQFAVELCQKHDQ
ncbi:acetate/propionate family kinase [Schlesneria sp. T3-172]|uniref:acetate/propionate family kinase n=1 Tax=Schlesneria sphaerica TaxID=3373610 RepID=UPI0037C55A68